MSFRVGDNVTCIDNSGGYENSVPQGKQYTVVGIDLRYDSNTGALLHLIDIEVPPGGIYRMFSTRFILYDSLKYTTPQYPPMISEPECRCNTLKDGHLSNCAYMEWKAGHV